MSKSIRKEEFIVCAAVRFTREHERTGAESFINVLCIDYEDESIKDSRIKFCSSVYIVLTKETKGFITNKNRFVDQKEALEITGWKNKLYFKDKEYLTPEDLLYYQSLIY